ncbi:MAG: hypothetical protein HYW25_01115 [Candidatus Aenigmarchaeota archaeon]|nr:hypothetical protein [Candidatus Aenigmarchaeota archaeon]
MDMQKEGATEAHRERSAKTAAASKAYNIYKLFGDNNLVTVMTTATLPELTGNLVVPAAAGSYPALGAAYRHEGSSIDYSPWLVRTGKNYYGSKAEIPEGIRMSTAAEELALQLALEKAGNDPRNAEVFNDLFARNEEKYYAWQWTETGLRVPKGRKPDAYETDAQGRKYWQRILLIGDQEIGDFPVPEGNGMVIVEWDEVSGLPRVTEQIAYPHEPYTTHFWFNPNPDKDKLSGHYDVAIGRRGAWPHGVDARCLSVDASYGRWDADSDGGLPPCSGVASAD